MKRKFERWMYGICWRGDWIARVIAPVWYRFYCPYPTQPDLTARACIKSGNCGCDNSTFAGTRADQQSTLGGEK